RCRYRGPFDPRRHADAAQWLPSAEAPPRVRMRLVSPFRVISKRGAVEASLVVILPCVVWGIWSHSLMSKLGLAVFILVLAALMPTFIEDINRLLPARIRRYADNKP